jgi:hypothetical protein
MARLRPSIVLSCLMAIGPAISAPAHAAAELSLERLASCADSWLDWKQDPVMAEQFRNYVFTRFEQEPRSPAWQPRRPVSVFGLPVVKAYPQSVGMALGFSLEVRGAPADVRRAMEKAIGRPLQCERAEGAVSCEAKLADRRIALVVAADEGRAQPSLIGCFYYYQQ